MARAETDTGETGKTAARKAGTARKQRSRPRTDRPGIRKILAMDGGGLYGLTTALWLKKLCQRDDGFLRGGDVQLFAGCSAGALNALLLAREKEPRDYLLRGGLEEFWRQPGTFSNSNPVTAWLSLFQIGAWLGAGDFLDLLRREFGDATLGDLHHDVLITSFNWTGGRSCGSVPPPPAWPSGADPAASPWPWPPWPWPPGTEGAAGGSPGAGGWPGTGGWPGAWPGFWPAPGAEPPPTPGDLFADLGADRRGWRPKFFKSFPDDERDRSCRVVDVAYAAATPPGLRAVLNGFGDGGTFNACPCADALAAAVADAKHGRDFAGTASPEEFDCIRDVLDDLKLLSLGVGAETWNYWARFIDLSFTQFSFWPTNPPAGVWWPPQTAVTLDGPTEDAVYISRQLLSANFHRMNPGILDVPTLVATIYSRFPQVRDALTRQIYAAVETAPSRAAVERTLEYLEARWHS